MYNKLLNNLEELKLEQFRVNLDTYIDLINSKSKTIIESLYDLTKLELEVKNERAKHACIKVANFPFIKTFDDFDFSFQPCLNKEKILDFKNFRFINKNESIILVGNPGVGKSHLAVSIGIECAKKRYSTYFITCNDLCAQLKRAHLENRLEAKIKVYAKYKILIIDEVGYLPVDIEASNMLFQLISKRYEKHCTIITTNSPFSKWAEIFGDSMIANAILDRLLHHSHIINITGKSYRINSKSKYLLESSILKNDSKNC
jgi:DNA replication protein DnaC